MSLTLHTLAPKAGSRSKSFRVGRGAGSGRGKTGGRGTKGQNSRSGGSNGLKLKGLKQMLLSFPKMRGFRSRTPKLATITFAQLAKFPDGGKINLHMLKEAGLVSREAHKAKVVSGGTLDKKLNIEGLLTTKTAKVAIEKVGGTIK